MSLQASVILTRVRDQLVDDGAVQRWTDAELLLWLSDGQRAIAAAQPNAASKVVSMALVAGTRQTVPVDGFAFLGLYRNLSAQGAPGRAVRITRRELLDTFNPDWHSSTPASTVTNYCASLEDPLAFYVYPPNDGTGNVEINYAFLPTELQADTDAITVLPIYQTALFYYVMAVAHMKDSDSAAGPQMAAFYMQQFSMYVASKDKADTENTANTKLLPFTPSVKGADQ